MSITHSTFFFANTIPWELWYQTFYISWEYAYAILWQLYMQHCSSLIINHDHLKNLFSKSKISYWPNFSPSICQNWYALIWAICLLIFALQDKYCQKSVHHWRNYCPITMELMPRISHMLYRFLRLEKTSHVLVNHNQKCFAHLLKSLL